MSSAWSLETAISRFHSTNPAALRSTWSTCSVDTMAGIPTGDRAGTMVLAVCGMGLISPFNQDPPSIMCSTGINFFHIVSVAMHRLCVVTCFGSYSTCAVENNACFFFFLLFSFLGRFRRFGIGGGSRPKYFGMQRQRPFTGARDQVPYLTCGLILQTCLAMCSLYLTRAKNNPTHLGGEYGLAIKIKHRAKHPPEKFM